MLCVPLRAQTYVGQLYADSPSERDNYMGVVQGASFLGATLGAFVVMPFAVGNGANAFYAIWLAIGLTVGALAISSFILVSPPNEESTREVIATPKQAKRILILVILASAFDSAGDVGTTMACSTILMGLFPKWGTPMNNNILLTLIIALVIGSMIFLTILKKKTGLAVTATIGALATLISQVRPHPSNAAARLGWQTPPPAPAPLTHSHTCCVRGAHSSSWPQTHGPRARTLRCGSAASFLASSPPSDPAS